MQRTLDNQYLAAIYLRLSKEDDDRVKEGGKTESNSIANQRSLIKEFLKKHPEITFVREFCDDGFTGTDFNRPAFNDMMESIKRGEINCIIVKDDCVIIEPTQKDLENQGFVAGSICF